jgi:ribokinase
MHPEILVVGSYVQDLAWRCADFPRPGETTVGTFFAGPGGKGSNQAVAAARAGGRVGFVGAIGRDSLGQSAREFYRKEGITAHFATKPAHATGTAAILVNAKAENEIIVALGANAVLARSDVPAAWLRSARIVIAQFESNLATTAFVLREARRHGATTILNPAPMRSDATAALLKHVDILIPNEREFIALLRPRGVKVRDAEWRQLSTSRLQALCRQLEVPTVIVTLGERGCFLSQPDLAILIPGHQGLKVIDTAGAGDAFVGGFAAGLRRFDGEVTRAAYFANATAALAVTKPGTAAAMPREREILRFLRQRGVSL